jgi:hypothetical protein
MPAKLTLGSSERRLPKTSGFLSVDRSQIGIDCHCVFLSSSTFHNPASAYTRGKENFPTQWICASSNKWCVPDISPRFLRILTI